MLNEYPFDPNQLVPTPVRLPSSFSRLPPPRFPEKRRVLESRQLAKRLVKKAGFAPGTYKSIEDVGFHRVEEVSHGLRREIDDLLTGADAVDLCATLYKRHEEITGHFVQLKHRAVLNQMRGIETGPSINVDNRWAAIAPHTEALRWLIEYCVKRCSANGRKIALGKVETLIALAGAFFEWDLIWENIAQQIFEIEFHVAKDFDFTWRPTDRTMCARHRFNAENLPYVQRSDQNLTNLIKPPGSEFSIENLVNLPEVQELEEPMELERGYKLSDWLTFAHGLIDSFESHEYFKSIGSKNLSAFLSRKWELDPDRLQHILIDHAISKATVANLSSTDLEPVGNARRDSRLLRRPVVSLNRRKEDVYLYGVETVSVGFKMIFDTIFRREQLLPGNTKGGPLITAIGRIQQSLGNEFRNYIAVQCRERNYEYQLEKGSVGNENTPQGEGFGPVDVFIVDRNHQRFVLVEAKDVADEGTVPKKMQQDRDRFLEFQAKLTKQTDWFAKRIDDLKHEFGLSQDETWTVEGAIVVKRPRPWMYSHNEPLKIVHEVQFLRALENGGKFVTEPTP